MLELTEENFDLEAREGLVVVDFYATWCGPCRAMSPILEQLTDAKVVKVDVDREPDLAMRFNVSSIPKIVILRDGQIVDERVGIQSKEMLQTKIDELKNA